MVAIHLQEPLLFPPSPVQIRNKKAKGQEMKELVEEVWGGGGGCAEKSQAPLLFLGCSGETTKTG